MKTEENQLDTFLLVSRQLRACTWDIFEEWIEETRLHSGAGQTGISAHLEEVLDELPTLIGGLTKIIQDPMFLMDLEQGGRLHEIAKLFGNYRHDAGYPLDKVLEDFGLLREKLWLFCERFVAPENRGLFELERRLNVALDRVIVIAAEAFYNRSSAELMELAQKDKLTGFLHSKAFRHTLDGEIARSKRYRLPLTLICADLDNFKRFNIEEGRLEGNRLLRDVAREISEVIRGTDYAARLAGDEFAIIMPHTDIKSAKRGAERVRRNVRKLRRDETRVTLSLGLASFPDNAGDNNKLIEQARSALYLAREEGGDVTWSPEMSSTG